MSKTITFSIRIPEELLNFLKKRAEEENRSVNNLIETIQTLQAHYSKQKKRPYRKPIPIKQPANIKLMEVQNEKDKSN